MTRANGLQIVPQCLFTHYYMCSLDIGLHITVTTKSKVHLLRELAVFKQI